VVPPSGDAERGIRLTRLPSISGPSMLGFLLFAPAAAQRTLEQVAGEWRVAAGAEPKDWATLRGSAALVPLDIASGVSSSAFVVVDDKNRLSVREGTPPKDAIAAATWKDAIEEIGWGYLKVETTDGSAASDDLAIYSAGLLEGALSHQRIAQFHHNANKLMDGMEQQHHALGNMHKLYAAESLALRERVGLPTSGAWTADKEPKESFDHYVRAIFLQSWGVLDGYNAVHPEDPMSLVDLMVLNSDGETPELEMALDLEESLLRQSTRDPSSVEEEAFLQTRLSFLQEAGFAQRSDEFLSARVKPSQRLVRRQQELESLTPEKWTQIKRRTGRCSALVRVADKNADLFVGHATFSDFAEMLRVFKYYDFPLKKRGARTVGFSSYPGAVSSTDDYYVTSSGLMVTETTISLLTDEPYDHLDDTGKALPDFIRIMAATFAAQSGKEWVDMMDKSATGLYGSQWMVVDYNKFTPGKPIQDGTLMVLEQVPTISHYEDESDRLRKTGFWSSENRAYFPDARQVSGFADAEEMHGKLFSSEHNPRATIFAATAPEVQTLADFRAEMRRNKWPHEIDGGPENTPDHAISARSDLTKTNPAPNGGVDAKVADSCMVKKLLVDAISGPTQDQKVFSWTDPETHKELFPGVPHEGLPDTYNFPWVRMTPAGYGVQKEATTGC